ncbi:MAG: GntR family transcriptional regulator [Spirochaetes bacterium]|nr:GntR family transcriptional regulator [Spirochaetota bacterium]
MPDKLKFEEVEERLQSDIKRGVFGDKLPSTRLLAERYNVSKTSIDRAIAELRASGDIETISRVGNIIRKKRSKYSIVGLLWPQMNSPSALFHETVDEIHRTLPESYTLLTQTYTGSAESERACLQKLLDHNLQGLFAFPVIEHDRPVNRDLYEKIIRTGVKTVFLMRDVRELPAASIYYDNASLIEAHFTKLASYGAQVFVHLSFADHEVERIRKRYFQMRYGDSPLHYWIDLAEIRRDNWKIVIDEIRERISALHIADAHPGMRIGFSCANDLYVYAAWRALTDSGIQNYKLLSDGWLRTELLDFFGITPSEIDMSVFNYPTLSFRADDIGRLSLERMRFMIDHNETIIESLPLAVYFMDADSQKIPASNKRSE